MVPALMSYHTTTRVALRKSPSTLGVRLGRLAIRKGLSVSDIASIIGASRTSVYSWFAGGKVSNAYRKPIEELIRNITN